MKILKSTLKEILAALGTRPVESGGIIGCENDCICAFVLDESYTSQHEYRLDVAFLNGEIQKWNGNGISFCGIVHSHLYGFSRPSESDRIYAEKLFRFGSNITTLLFPIVTFDADSNIYMDCYQFSPKKNVFEKIKITIAQE